MAPRISRKKGQPARSKKHSTYTLMKIQRNDTRIKIRYGKRC